MIVKVSEKAFFVQTKPNLSSIIYKNIQTILQQVSLKTPPPKKGKEKKGVLIILRKDFLFNAVNVESTLPLNLTSESW